MPELTHNLPESRYEAHIDGALAGFAEYQLADDLIVFTTQRSIRVSRARVLAVPWHASRSTMSVRAEPAG